MSNKLTQARLKEVLHYDPETGIFTWLKKSCNRWPMVGRPTGTPDGKGYLMVGIDQVRYKLHRLAVLFMTGALPAEQVDHINGVVDDNRWVNLRQVTASGSMQNRKLNKNSTTGLTGVTLFQGKPTASIGVNGKKIHLGTFSSAQEAHEAYLAAKMIYHTVQPTLRAQTNGL